MIGDGDSTGLTSDKPAPTAAEVAALKAEQLYAVLVSVQNDTLLLPNLGVAEVVSRDGLRAPAPGAPGWFAGLLNWQGVELPVARFERMNGAMVDAPGRRSRVVVINTVSGKLSAGRFGLLCEGYPHLVTLNRAAIRVADQRPGDNTQLILTRALVASQETVIPNLVFIEGELARVLAG
jgi:chemosensory pili system protein ChpC